MIKKTLGRIRHLNDEIALRATLAIGTMWCVYAFAIFVMIPLLFPKIEPVIMYISSSFLQLVFLPLIMVGQNVINKKSERRAQSDHKMIMQALAEIKMINARLAKKGAN